MTTVESFREEVEDFLRRSGMSATAFGKEAVGDPSFVPDLREGRAPSLRLVEKVSKYISARKSPPMAAGTARAAQ